MSQVVAADEASLFSSLSGCRARCLLISCANKIHMMFSWIHKSKELMTSAWREHNQNCRPSCLSAECLPGKGALATLILSLD